MAAWATRPDRDVAIAAVVGLGYWKVVGLPLNLVIVFIVLESRSSNWIRRRHVPRVVV